MRLKVSHSAANEVLLRLVNEGYASIGEMKSLYAQRKAAGVYDDAKDTSIVVAPVQNWADKVSIELSNIFPTNLEENLFSYPEIPFGAVSGDYNYQSLLRKVMYYVKTLNTIRTSSLSEYTDLPITARLYVEDIDSFSKVRDVNPSTVLGLLKNGYLEKSEDEIQLALEQILDVSFHKKDWGGEINDLYTSNLRLYGSRVETAFLLKGNGLKSNQMQIADCGKNGDQILRLCTSPARLFVIQFVGNITEAVVADLDGKVQSMRLQGKECWFCIIDGQDTARILHAYGKI